MAYWPKIAIILDAAEGYKNYKKQKDKCYLHISMGCRWSEVQILSPRPIKNKGLQNICEPFFMFKIRLGIPRGILKFRRIPHAHPVCGEFLFMRQWVSEKVHCSAISRNSC